MTQSIQNFDNRNNGYGIQPRDAAHQVRPQPQSVRIPDYYAPDDKRNFIDVLKETPMYTIGIRGFFGPLIDHPIASILTWFGCGFLLDKYTSACSGEYNKSLFKKLVDFGDNLQNSKFIQSKPIQSFLGLMKKSGTTTGNFANKSSVIKAMRETPTMPEMEMVKSEMIPQRQRVVHDFNQIVNELKLTGSGHVSLNKLALNKKDRELLKSAFKTAKISDIPEEAASSYIQLKRLGKADADIMNIIAKSNDGGVSAAKQAILKAFGNKDEAWIKAVQEDTIGAKIAEVQEATRRVGGKVKISMGNFKPLGVNLGVLTTPTKRIISCDNIFNRLYSLDGGAKTATGRFMSRFVQMIHRGLTFGGGKLGVLLFIAPAFVETAINVYKAEPNQKVGTGVSNLVNHISWVFTFPFALQIMHHVCGAKYAGMKEADIQKIREKLSEINNKNKKNGTTEGFKNFEEWNKERQKVNKFIKEKSRVKGQKWYTKAIRTVAGWITPDLGKVDGFNTGNWLTTKLSKARNLPRNLFGVPVRLIIFGLLTMGVIDAILNKGIKLIFGDSYDSMKEEEIKDAKKEQKKFLKEDLNERLYEAQKQKIAGITNSTQRKQTNAQGQAIAHHGAGANSNAVPYAHQAVYDNYSYIPSQQNIIKAEQKAKRDNYTYIPSQDSTIQSKNSNNSLARSYIPSQIGANISKTWDNSGLQAAIERSERAESKAIKVLSGNFDGM